MATNEEAKPIQQHMSSDRQAMSGGINDGSGAVAGQATTAPAAPTSAADSANVSEAQAVTTCNKLAILSEEDLREYPDPPDDDESVDTKVSGLGLEPKHISNVLTTKGKLLPAAQAWSSAMNTSLQANTSSQIEAKSS